MIYSRCRLFAIYLSKHKHTRGNILSEVNTLCCQYVVTVYVVINKRLGWSFWGAWESRWKAKEPLSFILKSPCFLHFISFTPSGFLSPPLFLVFNGTLKGMEMSASEIYTQGHTCVWEARPDHLNGTSSANRAVCPLRVSRAEGRVFCGPSKGWETLTLTNSLLIGRKTKSTKVQLGKTFYFVSVCFCVLLIEVWLGFHALFVCPFQGAPPE